MSDYQKGDWVRFYRDGQLILGIVEYVEHSTRWNASQELFTDKGHIGDTEVKEVRRASKERT